MRYAPPSRANPTRTRARRAWHRSALGVVTLAGASWLVVACGETVVQVDADDVAELLLTADSARIGVGRTFDLDALTLDDDHGLLVGQTVDWTSTNAAVVTVDEDGLLTGESIGTASVVASFGALRDTTHVTVVAPPVLVLSADSVGFTVTAGGADPAPDTVDVTNGGVLELLASVDSVVYLAGAADWLTAQLAAPAAPTTLALSVAASGITTTGVHAAVVWVSGLQADDSPAAVQVTLRVLAGAPFSMTLNDGDAQTKTAGTAVTVAPSVLVADQFGNPAAGASVTFAVTGGGGGVTGSPATANASGVARVGSWTLGTVAGANQLTATLGALPPVVFSATGTVGAATQVVVTTGNNQSALAGSAVGVPPAVSVRDQHGNGVTGVSVTFAVTSGGGSITGASQTSGAGGIATLGSWTLGTIAGPNTLSASAAGVGTPAVINATGLSGAADSIYLVAGNAQIDTVAATLATAYRVRVVDSNGNGVAGIPIAWTATYADGTITPSTNTDAQGYATATRVLPTIPGPDSATATVGGLAGSPVRFLATANVGSPHAVTVTAGAAQTDTVNQIVPIAPQVRVADKFDNPIQGNGVTFQVTAGGGTVIPTTPIMTSAGGTATVTSWRLGTTAGANRDTLTATATGAGIMNNPIRIVATSVAGPPTQFLVLSGDAQIAITGTPVAVNPTVVLRDAFNNGISGRTISFTSSNGGVGSASPTTNANGQASTTWTVFVTSGTMQANGSFPDTLLAATSGFTTQRILGSAVYSFATHVNPYLETTCAGGCHTSGGSQGGISWGGTASQNRAVFFDVAPSSCTPPVSTPPYRRVAPGGGIAASDTYSILIRKLDNTIGSPGGNCIAGHSGGEFAPGAALLETFRAWIRNGAPNN
ncbi:MAG: beta strand repeat-containing protein [Gemmatimonadales bacterium]